MIRSIRDYEMEIVSRLAEPLEDHVRSRILSDLRGATAESQNEDDSIIRFQIHGYEHPEKRGQCLLPFEGKMTDSDGAEITALLFLDINKRLYELELIRWGEGNLIGPDVDTLRVIASPPLRPQA